MSTSKRRKSPQSPISNSGDTFYQRGGEGTHRISTVEKKVLIGTSAISKRSYIRKGGGKGGVDRGKAC